MFCHKCGFEYEGGITRCGKCNTELKPEPLRKKKYVYKNLILLDSFTNVMDANLAKEALESEGIEAHLLGDDMVAVNWLLMNAIGGLRLMVRSGEKKQDKRNSSGLSCSKRCFYPGGFECNHLPLLQFKKK